MKDYDFTIFNHPRKANVVADTISRKRVIIANIRTQKVKISGKWTIKHKFIRSILANISIQSKLVEVILAEQKESEELPNMVELANKGKTNNNVVVDGGIRFGNRIWIPKDSDLKSQILKEVHQSKYTLHPGTMEMYRDLQRHF